MNLHVLGSNSSGNMYLLEGKDEALLLEAGLRFSNIKKLLGANISKIRGVLISHEHL